MLRKSNFLCLLVISSLIIQICSAAMWELEKKDDDIVAVRQNRKKQNVHRGVLFSYSTDMKNDLCRDLYHDQLYEEAGSLVDASRMPDTVEDTTEDFDEIIATDAVPKDTKEAGKVASYTGGTSAAPGRQIPKTDDVADDEPSDETMEDDDEMKIVITDDTTNIAGPPKHALMVKKVATKEKDELEQDLFFNCAILNSKYDPPKENMYSFSTAFLSDWFYISTPVIKSPDQPTPTTDQTKQSHDQEILSESRARLNHYLAKSPVLRISETKPLEDGYAAVRYTLKMLAAESAKYVELIIKKNDLTGLSIFKRQLACSNVLSAPIYQKERLEAAKNFNDESDDEDDDDDDASFEDTDTHVSFKNITYDHEGFVANSVPCYGYEEYDDDPDDEVDLFLTPSFNNRDSLYVLKEETRGKRRWLLNKYFEKVSILTHARRPVDETDAFAI